MKKLALIILVLTFFSCTTEEVKKQSDCNCNRVVEVLTLNVVAGGGNIGTTTMYRYTTINDCTGIQRDSGWSTNSVSKGDCK